MGYRKVDGTLETRLTPGFPAFLTAVFGLSRITTVPEARWLAIFTLVCVVAAATMIHLNARLLWSSRLGLIPAIAWLTYPLALWLTKQPNSELPFLPMFFASTYLTLRVLICRESPLSLGFATGLVTGLTMLVRPIAIGLPIVQAALILMLRRGRSTWQAVMLCVVLGTGSLVAVLPWEIWLYAVTGKVVTLSTGGASGIRDGLTFAVGGYKKYGHFTSPEVREVMETVARSYDDAPSAGGIARVLWGEMLRNPVGVLKLLGLKLIRSWFGTDSQRFELPILLGQIAYLIVVLWSSVICWRSAGHARIVTVAVWAITFYFWAMTWISMSIVRYMVPAMGLLFLLIPALIAAPPRAGDAVADDPVQPEEPVHA